MIDAMELRKDNWVNAKHQGQTNIYPYRIVAIEETTVRLANYRLLPEESVSDCENADLEPIPLTPFILEKCLDKKAIIKTTYKREEFLSLMIKCYPNYLIIDFEKELPVARLTKDPYADSGISAGILESIHQLQNLYFALTGEDLLINL